MAIDCFEDIVAWQKARQLVRDIYRETRRDPCARDFRYCSQIQSASISIMSNIAEGYERKMPRQFEQFLTYAKASCAEVRSLLYVGLDIGYFDSGTFEQLMVQSQEIGRVIAGFRKSLDTRRNDPAQPRIPNSKLGTRHSTLGTQNSELGTRNSELKTRNSELGTQNSELEGPSRG